MKRSIIFCVTIFVLIILVIVFEAIYTNSLTAKIDKIVVECLGSEDKDFISENTEKIIEIFDKTRHLNNRLIPTGILEDISITLGDMQQYIKQDQIDEYKVSANQLRQHMTHIYSTGISRNLIRLKEK